MYRSPTLSPDQIDYLYSELTCVALVSRDPSGSSTSDENVPPPPPRGSRTVCRRRAAITYKDVTHALTPSSGAGARQVAGGLAALGLEKAIASRCFSRSASETVESVFGVSAAGAAFVPINPLLRPSQVAYILRDCDVRVLITTSERLALLTAVLEECPAVRHVIVVGDDGSAIDGEGDRHYAHLGRTRGRGARVRAAARRSTSTWQRSSTRPAAPACRRVSSSATATSIVGAKASATTSRTRRRRRDPRRTAAELRRGVQPAHDGASTSARTSSS